MPLTEGRLRAQVERKLGQPLPDERWAYFRDDTAWVVSVLEGEENVSRFVQHIRKVLGLFGTTQEPPATPAQSLRKTRSAGSPFPGRAGDAGRTAPTKRGSGLTRQDALCTAIAALAGRDAAVRAFRREALSDDLLTYALDSSREGVEAWIARQVEHERPHLAAFAGEPPVLTYIAFLGQGVETTPVAPGGVLDRLRQLAERLADQYHWEQAAAAAFVLTGAEPNVATFRITTRPNHHLPALSRVVIEVDPHRLPDEVAAVYQQVRDRLIRSGTRQMSEKHLGLAAFAAMRSPGEPDDEQLAAWNALVPNPKWRYETKYKANFVRDRERAFARLIPPDYQLPMQEETSSYDDFILQRDKGAGDTTNEQGNDESDDA